MRTTANNSLDRSGGSVFRIKRDAATVALIRAARSTLTLDTFVSGMALTLKQRAYAGLWFMTAGAIPVLVVGSVVSSGLEPLHTFDVVIWFLVVPLLATGLIGSLLGARILDASRVRSGWRAAFRGLIVAVAAFLSSVILISILLTVTDISSPFDKDELFVRTLFMTLMLGTLVVGWLVVIVGVLAGWLLYQLQASKEKRSGMS